MADDYRNAVQDKIIAELAQKLDRAFAHVDDNRNQITKLQTVLIGVTGANGVKGDVATISIQFESYRREIREGMTKMTSEWTRAIAGLREDLDKSRRQRRAELISVVGLCLVAIGLLIAIL